jgi:hypothetical protein
MRIAPHHVVLVLAAGLGGCSEQTPPVLSPLGDQRAFVNTELVVGLSASDADGDALQFGFASELPDIALRARIEPAGEGRALFHWTPLASDLGQHGFDFFVSDGTSEARETVSIEVEHSDEGSGAPVFVQPLGTGTTLDLEKKSCIEVAVAVEDPDSLEVALTQEEPVVEGAELAQEGPFSARWKFCPTPAQIDADDRYTATLGASDGVNDKTLKSYLVVLRSKSKSDCPGAPPAVEHAPADVASVADLAITATVTDDLGIKYEPLLYYAASDPGDAPDLAAMTQVTMKLATGDMKSGTWKATVPNPVASAPAGTKARLYYLVTAQDNDDTAGNCDHVTQAPAAGSFSVTVENPGGAGGLGLCADCTSDAQCGGPGDNCVFLDGGHHCFKGCTKDTDCPSGYYCSFSEFTSIDDVKARQCIPNDYQCADGGGGSGGGGGGTSCSDDGYEDNDTLSQASAKPALAPGTLSAKSCPATTGDDEDWYKITLTASAKVTVTLSGGSTTDLDLALKDATGAVVAKSEALGSSESLTTCLEAGTYYLHVYAWGMGANSYTLSWSKQAQICVTACVDDAFEDDDSASQARPVDLDFGKYSQASNQICAGDDDWYSVYMYAGEQLHVALTFAQATSKQDLDVYVYKDGVNLTGCSEQSPFDCDPLNGQSGTSNEKLVWPISKSGTYHVVVHGWEGSANVYGICIGLSATQCPKP